MNLNQENNLIDISEQINEVSRDKGISYVFLHEVFSQNYKDISTFAAKKFIGVDSRLEVLLDWAYTQEKELAEPIIEHYRRYQQKEHEIVGLRAKQEALIEAMKYQTCKWKNEREATK